MGEERPSCEEVTIHRNHRMVFYLGEGAIGGLVLYLVVALVVRFPALSFDDQLLVIVALFLLAGIPKMVGVIVGRGYVEHSPTMEAWKETRQLRWVGVVGLLVAGVLVVGSVLAWEWEWPVTDVTRIMIGLLLLGGMGRAFAVYLSENRAE